MSSRALAFLLASLALAPAARSQIDRLTGPAYATRSEVMARNGMVCTAQPLATQVGLAILQAGGSAVDAAIAANITLGLVEPTACGPGGDLYAIVYDAKTKKLYGLNGSGRSPLGLSYDELKAELAKRNTPYIPQQGLISVSVPGAVDAWYELHQRFGRLPMKDLFAPAIQYAEEGFPVTEYIAYMWGYDVRRRQASPVPGAYMDVYAPGGKPPAAGDVFRNPGLARTYRLLAEGGRDVFYRGTLADEFDAYFRANGGWLRKVDFERHTSTWVEPVSVNYRGYDVYELPPNGQGIAALQMLKILEGFDLRAMGLNSKEMLHVMIEAKKLAFEDRAKFYADTEFSQQPIKELLSPEYAAARRKLINLERAARTYDAGQPLLHTGDTTYLCVADKEGNMVSLIQSNFIGMGSGAVPPNVGFGFQNRGALFTMEPGHANVYAPGKRPFHTIIPGFVMKDGEPWEAFGLMGGDVQPQGHVQVLVNQIDFGLNVQAAGDVARWKHEGSSEPTGQRMLDGGRVLVESGIPFETVRELIKMGHDVRARTATETFGGYQAIRWDKERGVYFGASESRKDGHAAGY